MSLKKFETFVKKSEEGQRLDHFVFAWLKQKKKLTSKSQVRRLIIAGAVCLNQKCCRIASKPLKHKTKVTVHIDKNKLILPKKKINFDLNWIVFEDSTLLVLNKPCGLPTQPTVDRSRDNLFQLAKNYLKSKNSDTYLALHHRLDAGTSGLILFCKEKESNISISNQFQNHEVKKKYLALCEGSQAPKHSWEIKNFLGDGRRLKKKKRYKSVLSNGKKAITKFKFSKKLKHSWLIEAFPKTGRSHQIRVHLSEIGYPIVGDDLYGSKTKNTRLHLQAIELSLIHPKTLKRVFFKVSPDF